jgi:DNA-binding GntR family transcriptional regulator
MIISGRSGCYLNKPKPVEPPAETEISKQQLAYDAIREAIIREEYEPNQLLSGRELSSSLGISRTPVMEALRQLAYEGFVRLVPAKGVLVSSVRRDDMIELFQIREGIEGVAAKMCALRQPDQIIRRMDLCLTQAERAYRMGKYSAAVERDHEFHALLISGSGNARMLRLALPVLEQTKRATYFSATDPKMVERSLRQHRDTLNAIIAGDAEQAEKCAQKHMVDVQEYAKEYPLKHDYKTVIKL